MYINIFIICICVCCILYIIISYFNVFFCNENFRCIFFFLLINVSKYYSFDVFIRNCNWKNEKVFVIIYSILVVFKGNMYVYVRDEEYFI